MNLDKVFGIHAQAAQLRSYRGEILANNIANADTPGYKARDLDFNNLLKQINSTSQVTTGQNSGPSQPTYPSRYELGNELYFRHQTQASLDGNSVDMDTEKAEFSKNAMAYQASMSFLGGKVKGLMAAIRGE